MAVEFGITLEVDISLHVSDRKQEADLRTNAYNARLERTDPVARSTVTC